MELDATAIMGALERSGATAQEVDSVIMGHGVRAGRGQDPARQSSLAAGIGWNLSATRLNKACLCGLAVITDAACVILVGAADVVVRGGQESLPQAPHQLPGSGRGWTCRHITAIDSAANTGLTDAFNGDSMGVSTAGQYSVRSPSGEQPDEVATAVKIQGWAVMEPDFIEINEACEAVGCRPLKAPGIPRAKTNILGGTNTLGQPLGASGARPALTAAVELKRRGSGKPAVSLCSGGGKQGEALLLGRED